MPDLRHPEDGLRRFRRSIAAPRGSVGYYKEHPAGPQVLFRYKTLCFRSFLPVIPNGTGDFQPKESCPAGAVRPIPTQHAGAAGKVRTPSCRNHPPRSAPGSMEANPAEEPFPNPDARPFTHPGLRNDETTLPAFVFAAFFLRFSML